MNLPEFVGTFEDTDTESKEQAEDSSYFNPMKFLTNLKKYILNKLFAHKYETTPDQAESVSILSYKELEFDSNITNTTLALNSAVSPAPNFTLTIDKKLLEAIETVVNQKHHSETVLTPGKLELLQIIEKTFERQLGIFEELLYLVQNNKKTQHQIVEKKAKIEEIKKDDYKIEMEKSINGFLKDLIKNISAQLSDVADNIPQPLSDLVNTNEDKFEDSVEEQIINNEVPTDDYFASYSPEAPPFPFSPFGGDNFEVKPMEVQVECECNKVNENGGAVPVFGNFIEDEEEFIDELLEDIP